MDLRIRHADDRDLSTIVSLVRATLQDMEAVGGDPINQDKNFWKMYADTIVELIRKDDRLYLLAQTGSRSIGFLEGNINNAPAVFALKTSFHLGVVYVVPKYRQRGIATALIQEALGWASEQGCREADLNVLFNNAEANKLYKKLGFKVFQYALRMNLPMTES